MYRSETHMKMLHEGSGITQEVIATRGYYSIEKKAALKRLGFSDTQRNVPALVVPMYSPTGVLVTHQIRPDIPREDGNGTVIKYETPAGSPIRLDVNPSQTERMRDASVCLWVTEGVKKADSLVCRDQCAVALQGVWCWQKDGVPLRDWEDIRLWGRPVCVIFDSDVTTNPKVQTALEGLVGFLRGRGARVTVAYLPDAPGGGKQGVDDYLVAGHSVDDLLGLATTTLREPPEGAEAADEPDTQAAELVRYADDAHLFHTPDGVSYAAFPLEDR